MHGHYYDDEMSFILFFLHGKSVTQYARSQDTTSLHRYTSIKRNQTTLPFEETSGTLVSHSSTFDGLNCSYF